jgi:hypothetical protein
MGFDWHEKGRRIFRLGRKPGPALGIRHAGAILANRDGTKMLG